MASHEIYLRGYHAFSDETPYGIGLPLGTEDSYGLETLHLNLDENWEGNTITATFSAGGTGVTTIMNASTNVVTVPTEALASSLGSSTFRSIVFAAISDNMRIISCNLPYLVYSHADAEGVSSEPTDSIWQQMLELSEAAARYYMPTVDSDGNISWTAVGDPTLPAVETQNIRGPQGGYYIPLIDDEGNISWSPSVSGMDTVESANIMGPSGGYYTPVISSDWRLDWIPSEDSMPDIPSTNFDGLVDGVEELIDDKIDEHNLDITAHPYILNLITQAEAAIATAQAVADTAANAASDIAYTILIDPSQSGVLYYTGEELTPEWNSYNTKKLAIGGTTSATDVGTYTATFTPINDYTWEDGSTDAHSVTWTIQRMYISVPSQSGTLTYNGASQTPKWSNYDSVQLTLSVTAQTNAGTYTAGFTPTSNYQWVDGTITEKTVSWKIGRADIATVPSQSGSLLYTGEELTPVWADYNTEQLTISGTTSATEAGVYTAVFTPTANYQWSDGTTTGISVRWRIALGIIDAVPSQLGILYWTGKEISPVWVNYDEGELTIGGTTSGTSVGTYSASFTPNENYTWSDGSTTAVWVNWTISSNPISTYPSVTQEEWTYTGSAITPTYNDYDEDQMTISGSYTATAIGNYTVMFTPKTGYCWADGSTSAYTVSWSIVRITVAVPVQNGTLTYNGSAQSPSFSGYDTAKMTVSYSAQTNAGTYTATFTTTTSYIFSTGSTTATVSWTINRASISVPTANAVTYNGAQQSGSFSGYDSSTMTIGGTYTATNAGTYTATFTPTSNYQWTDGTTTAKSVTWTISQLTGSITLSVTELSFLSSDSQTVTVTQVGDNTLSVLSSDTSVVTASISGTTITVTYVGNGSATITISAANSTNYTTPASQTISVTTMVVSSTFNNNDWSTIAQVCWDGYGTTYGTAASYWSVGDRHSVVLNGSVGAYTFSSETAYCYIINMGTGVTKVTTGTGNWKYSDSYQLVYKLVLQFGFYSSASTKQVAFCDSRYGVGSSTTAGFKMLGPSYASYNSGWSGSYMRNVICPAFESALPTEVRDNLIAVSNYTCNDATSDGNTSSSVTTTDDTIYLLAEYEVFGTQYHANQYEKDNQSQCTYYANGNSKLRYKHTATSTACIWWLRSPAFEWTDDGAFLYFGWCAVSTSGGYYDYTANYSYGFAPVMTFCGYSLKT